MIRDLVRLGASRYDLLVVGGGVYGLAAAYDASLRGLSVALVERGDFGGGASFNHLKTVHGGLRSLQTGRPARGARVDARTPHLRPNRAAPGGSARISPAARGPICRVIVSSWPAGLFLDRLLAYDRNEEVDPLLDLPGGRVVSPCRMHSRCSRSSTRGRSREAHCGTTIRWSTRSASRWRSRTGRPSRMRAGQLCRGRRDHSRGGPHRRDDGTGFRVWRTHRRARHGGSRCDGRGIR